MTIATIISISGQAWARDEAGNLRELRVGDTLQEGETLVTSDNGRVELDFADDLDPTVIEGGQEVVMTPDLDAEQPVAAEEASAQDEDLEALLTAIDEGEGDLLEDLDATAAGAGGAGGEGGGHDFVRLARITENVNPLAYEYGLASLSGIPEVEGQAVEEQALEDEPGSIPTVSTDDIDGDGDTVWESALPDGSGGGVLTTSGTFQIDTGTDLLALIEVQDTQGNWIAVGAEGSTIAGEYGTLAVNPDGSWTYTLDQSIDHPAQGETGEADQLADTFAVRVTDDDGDVSAPATLTIDVNDDGPVASDDAVGEIAEDSSVVIDVLANDTAGADGVDLATGIAVATGPSQGSVVYNGNGTFTYTPAPGAEGSDSFSYTLTDADGDTSTATVSLSIAADSTPTVTVADASVDETGGLDADTQAFSTTYGNDSAGTLALSAAGATWDASTSTLTADNGDWQIVVNADGTYTVTQLQAMTHPDASDPNDAITVTVTADITDNEGDPAQDTFTVTFLDDGPVAANDVVTEEVAEDGSVDIDVFANDTAGADGVDLATGIAVATGPSMGSVVYNGNGTFTYTPDPGAEGSDSFSYTLTDADGDTSTATVSLSIAEDSTPTASPDTAAVDDEGLAGGIVGGTFDDATTASATFSDTLPITTGGDEPVTVDFAAMDGATGTIGQEEVSYSWAGGVLTATITSGTRAGTDLFTVEVTDATTGAYTVTLLTNVLHAEGPNNENETDPTAALTYTVTDADNSTASSSLTVSFDDDEPTVQDLGSVQAPIQVTEGASTPEGSLTFAGGADGATVTAVNGVALVFDESTGFSQSVDVGTAGSIQVKADGTYVFTGNEPTDNPLDGSATFTVTDADGDTAQATMYFQVTDANAPTASPDTAAVDDEGLAGGIVGGTFDDTTTASATFSDTLPITTGGDEPVTVDFAAMDGATGSIGQEEVSYSWAGGVLTATITSGTRAGTDLFTVEVTDATTGAYTVTLLTNVLHAEGPNNENETDPTAALTYTVTDADNSTASSSLTVSFDDDEPVAVSPARGFVVNEIGQLGAVTGVLLDSDGNVDDNYGADQGGIVKLVADSSVPSGYTASSQDIYYYVSDDGLRLIGSTLEGSDFATVSAQVDGEYASHVVFELELDPDQDVSSSDDTYSFTLYQQVDGGAGEFNTSSGAWSISGGNTNYVYFADTSGNDLPSVLITPTGVDGDQVNTTANGVGVSGGAGGQDVAGGEAVRVDFVENISGTPSQTAYDPATVDHSFTNHVLVNGAVATFSMNNGTSTVAFGAFDDSDFGQEDEQDDVGDYTQDNISWITINDVVVEPGGIVPVGYTVDFTGDGVVVGGISDGDAIAVFTEDGYTTVEYAYVSGSSFELGGFGASSFDPGALINMDFDLEVSDADGDSVLVEGGISMQLSPDDHVIEMGTDNDDTLNAGTDQASTLVGLAGDDILSGDAGEDILVGGPGSDSLVGGAGADTFVWNFGDQGTSTDPAEDTVTDFTASEGDVLDISDLLGNMSEGADLSSYIHAEESASGTILHISSEGNLAADDISTADQTILLSDVDMAGLDSAQFLQSLIDNGQLDIE